MTQARPASLTPIDEVLARLRAACEPVAPLTRPLAEAVGCVAAAMAPLPCALPAGAVAMVDGWALTAADLAGASAYTPAPLPRPPAFVGVGDTLPEGCDCVLEDGAVERVGSVFQALAEAIPGQGVRRAGEDCPAGQALIGEGRAITGLDLFVAHSAGLTDLRVRCPRLALVDVPAADGATSTADMLARLAAAAGAQVMRCPAAKRDVAAVAAALAPIEADLIVIIGGTGAGPGDATVAALAAAGAAPVHGFALQPGRSAAVGLLGRVPVLACPGAGGPALAVWWTVAEPILDRLAGRDDRPKLVRPLARKIASQIGLTEVVLLRDTSEGWLPLAIGDLPLAALAAADAWVAVAPRSEGHAAGETLAASPLRVGS